MKGNISQLMQQAQKMQENLKKAQEEMAGMEVTGEAGGGMVKATISGKYEVRRIHIDPSLLEDAEMLEDLVTAAMNDAVNKVQETTKEKLSDMTGGMPIPPGMGPF